MFTQEAATIVMMISPLAFIPTTFEILKNPNAGNIFTFVSGSIFSTYFLFYYLNRTDFASVINCICWLAQYIPISARIIIYKFTKLNVPNYARKHI